MWCPTTVHTPHMETVTTILSSIEGWHGSSTIAKLCVDRKWVICITHIQNDKKVGHWRVLVARRAAVDAIQYDTPETGKVYVLDSKRSFSQGITRDMSRQRGLSSPLCLPTEGFKALLGMVAAQSAVKSKGTNLDLATTLMRAKRLQVPGGEPFSVLV